MDGNKNSDFKINSNSVENSNSRPGSSISHPRPDPTNSQSGTSSSSSNLQERDREHKLLKKPSSSDNDDVFSDKRETSNRINIEENNKRNGKNKRPNENSSDSSFPSLYELAITSPLSAAKKAWLQEVPHTQIAAFRPPSSPPIPYYSEHECATLAERLQNEETFKEALEVLITWLVRGECNKENFENFYSLIQISFSHVKRLRSEKSGYKKEVKKANENFMNNNRVIESEINEIEKVFIAAETHEAWEHFTRTQMKQIQEVKKDILNLKERNSIDLDYCEMKEEMEWSVTKYGVMVQEATAVEVNEFQGRLNNVTEELDPARLRFGELEESENLQKASNDSSQKEAFRAPSPPQIPHYSELRCATLVERLQNEETFKEALEVLITWLVRGECNKENFENFYSLIQILQSHVKRLSDEKSRYKEEMEQANENFKNNNWAIEIEINEIEKVFVSAWTQKVLVHFSRIQREKMEEMKNDTLNLKEINSIDLVVGSIRIEEEEEEMQFSDSEDEIMV